MLLKDCAWILFQTFDVFVLIETFNDLTQIVFSYICKIFIIIWCQFTSMNHLFYLLSWRWWLWSSFLWFVRFLLLFFHFYWFLLLKVFNKQQLNSFFFLCVWRWFFIKIKLILWSNLSDQFRYLTHKRKRSFDTKLIEVFEYLLLFKLVNHLIDLKSLRFDNKQVFVILKLKAFLSQVSFLCFLLLFDLRTARLLRLSFLFSLLTIATLLILSLVLVSRLSISSSFLIFFSSFFSTLTTLPSSSILILFSLEIWLQKETIPIGNLLLNELKQAFICFKIQYEDTISHLLYPCIFYAI